MPDVPEATDLESTIDRHLAQAERQFDARIRALGGTPQLSPTQLARALVAFEIIAKHARAAFASIATAAGVALGNFGTSLAYTGQPAIAQTLTTRHPNIADLAIDLINPTALAGADPTLGGSES